MKHFAASSFWYHYRELPEDVQRLADKNFRLLGNNPYHLSLHFKKLRNRRRLHWSRVQLLSSDLTSRRL